MKKAIVTILLALLLIVSLLLSLQRFAQAEPQNFNFFSKMMQIYDERDCYVKMSVIDNTIYAGLILHGPAEERLSELYLYNTQTREFAVVHAWAKNNDDLQNTLHRIGLKNPMSFISPETSQLNPFALLETGIQLVFDR